MNLSSMVMYGMLGHWLRRKGHFMRRIRSISISRWSHNGMDSAMKSLSWKSCSITSATLISPIKEPRINHSFSLVSLTVLPSIFPMEAKGALRAFLPFPAHHPHLNRSRSAVTSEGERLAKAYRLEKDRGGAVESLPHTLHMKKASFKSSL